jgi:hypothetical protein
MAMAPFLKDCWLALREEVPSHSHGAAQPAGQQEHVKSGQFKQQALECITACVRVRHAPPHGGGVFRARCFLCWMKPHM